MRDEHSLGPTVRVAVEDGDGACLLRLIGVIDERFDPEPLAALTRGHPQLVLDLEGITRISSFGVRQWVAMLGTLSASRVFFVRAPPILVSQMAMVVGFLGKGTPVSVLAPYQCDACDLDFTELLDLRKTQNAEAFEALPLPRCPRCGTNEDVLFDDDASVFFSPFEKRPPPTAPRGAGRLIARAHGTSEDDVDDDTSPMREAQGGDAHGEARVLERYSIKRKLGVGGMAEVFLGTQQGVGGFEKKVVIKRLLPHLQTSPEAVEMFLEEARLGAALTSPNVIQVYELGRDGTNYSIIMEHISGHDLGKLIYASHTTGRRIPIAIACRIAHDICSGLHAAHTFRDEKGRLRPIIHRDISPENVLISVSGNVKILDFGIARQTTSEHHQSNIYRGKIIYSPPEQILRKVVDTRADIYAAGLVLYVMIAGVHPFHRPTPALSVEAVLNAEAPPLRSLRQDVPADVAALVEQALARDPDRRVLTAEAMTRGLDACMAKRGLVATETHVEAWLRDLVREAPEGTFAPRERAPPASANTSQATVALVPDHATTPHGVVEEVQQTLWALPRISRHDDVPLSATPRQDDGDER